MLDDVHQSMNKARVMCYDVVVHQQDISCMQLCSDQLIVNVVDDVWCCHVV